MTSLVSARGEHGLPGQRSQALLTQIFTCSVAHGPETRNQYIQNRKSLCCDREVQVPRVRYQGLAGGLEEEDDLGEAWPGGGKGSSAHLQGTPPTHAGEETHSDTTLLGLPQGYILSL